jgi:hypothetical protein
MVELLLENGANSNIRDKFERRPIHWASFVGYTDIIKLLKKYDADINCIDKEVTELFVSCGFPLYYRKKIQENRKNSRYQTFAPEKPTVLGLGWIELAQPVSKSISIRFNIQPKPKPWLFLAVNV